MNNSRTSNYKPFSKIDESITDFRMKSIILKFRSKMDVDVWAATCDTLAETSIEKKLLDAWIQELFSTLVSANVSHVAAQTSKSILEQVFRKMDFILKSVILSSILLNGL